MSRIHVVDPQTASGQAKTLLDAVQAKLGVTPNFIRVLANSPAALNAFLGLYSIGEQGKLAPKTAESIALAVAQQNTCQYCVSAHTAIGHNVGLSDEEITANRQGQSHDAKAAAAVAFASALIEHTGAVTAAELAAVRAAGYDDADIVEIIIHVSLNVLTNFIGKASQVDIDFPKIAL